MQMTLLSKLKSGQSATVISFTHDGPVTRRLMELGLVAGKKIKYIRRAPLRDPIQIKVGDSSLSLRNAEASLVLVELSPETVLQ